MLVCCLFLQDIISVPTVDLSIKIENGTMVGPMKVEDVKKEFYQLLATTTDPNVVCLMNVLC